METKEVLKNLGIEERETVIYLANLEIGIASAKEIAKKANIQRTYFYDISDNLIKIGIVKQIKAGKKTLFQACEPEKLIELQEEKLKELKNALPRLKALQNTKGEKPKVYFYEGKDGINQINEDTLRYKSEIIGFTTPRFVSADEEKLSQEYIKKRIAAGIKARVIGEVSEEMLQIQKKDIIELRKTKMLPTNIFTSQVEIGIYGNRSYFANYKDECGLIIEDTEIAKTLKNIFELVWNSGRIVE